jgi:hypothetical protein
MIEYEKALLAAIKDDGISAVPGVAPKAFRRFLAVRQRKTTSSNKRQRTWSETVRIVWKLIAKDGKPRP